MRTPSGAECALYYEDLTRGRSIRECRAVLEPGSAAWKPGDCSGCPVPAILVATGGPHRELRIRIGGKWRGRRRIKATVTCTLHGGPLADPFAGCPACNAEADELLRRAFE
ncbi:MAG: hypothetical protein JXP37_00160 [Coriobacteriia bacterium]|nr:hypothetical protein [Coriobacteriia bacterium]